MKIHVESLICIDLWPIWRELFQTPRCSHHFTTKCISNFHLTCHCHDFRGFGLCPMPFTIELRTTVLVPRFHGPRQCLKVSTVCSIISTYIMTKAWCMDLHYTSSINKRCSHSSSASLLTFRSDGKLRSWANVWQALLGQPSLGQAIPPDVMPLGQSMAPKDVPYQSRIWTSVRSWRRCLSHARLELHSLCVSIHRSDPLTLLE